MNDRVRAIMTKEWLDLRRNRTVLGTLLALPILLTTMACGIMATAARTAPPSSSKAAGLPSFVLEYTRDPHEGALVMVLLSGLMLFSLVPVILPTILAAHSIVGEKLARSLEPLLATPIRTWELLLGKLLTMVTVAVIPSLLGYAIYLAVIGVAAPPVVFRLAASPAFLLTVGVVGPLASICAVTIGMMVSARAADLQTAQGLSGLIVLPVIGLGMAQLFGAVAVTVVGALAKAGALVVADVGLVLLCASVFERETILSRWK